MTYSELTAAMWDGRSVTLTDHAGRSIEAVPTTLAHVHGRDPLWVVGYYARGLTPPRGAIVMRFDSFDGH